MNRLSAYVFDTYDDEGGQILQTVFDNPSDLPTIIKTAQRLTPSEIDSLPDDQFALIMFDGAEKLKKYATVDSGNTILSVLYLLKQAHLLPEQVVKTAANNLMSACELHGISIPSQLKVAAMTGVSPVSGKSQSPYVRGAKVNQIQYPVKEPGSQSHDNPSLGNADAAWDDVSDRTNVSGTPGSNFMELPVFPQKEKEKTAAPEGAQVIAKQKSWRESPYFDMSGWDPSQAYVDEPAQPERTLVDGHYPVDGYDQVKTAALYFKENWTEMDPRTRHQYCVKLASRMDELGMDVPDKIQRYGSETYASDVDSYINARRSYVHDEYHEGLDLLIEKRAYVTPGVFAEALAEFDKMAGINWNWDGQIADPWWSTFGPSIEKTAEEDWRFDVDGTRIREEDLEYLARNGHERLCKSFGADFAKEFCKNPKTFFNSLPDPNKLMLARLASDRHSGTFTE